MMGVFCDKCGHVPKRYGEYQLSGDCDFCEQNRQIERLRAELDAIRSWLTASSCGSKPRKQVGAADREMLLAGEAQNWPTAEKDAEIERLRAALKFYADPESYDRHVTNIDEHGCDYSTRPVVEDDGERARKALGVQDTKEDE